MSATSAKRPDAPFVFAQKQHNAIRLAAVDPAALDLGLVPGLALADALAAVPDLVVLDHDPGADQRLLERLADACERYTPLVMLDPPDGLLLDTTGCAHLFGGESGLADDAGERLTRAGMTVRCAFGYAPLAAHALARFRTAPATDEHAAVRQLGIAALELEPETGVALRRAGLKTIADLSARPASMLAARFGAGTVDRLARLLGEADSRLTPRRALPAVMVERRFSEPIARTEFILSILTELAKEAAQALEARSAGGRCFAARLFRSDGEVRDIMVETGQPSRDPAVLDRLFRERIESLADPIDPGFGFDMVRLGVARLEPMKARQLSLGGDTVAEAQCAELVDRLTIRLGRDRVRRFVARDTHIPEKAVRELPAIETPVPAQWAMAEPGEPPKRPIYLFDPPQQIDVIAAVPDGPPQRFRWRRILHEVNRYEGPERIAPLWWRLKEGEGLTRDYYRVEDMRGRRFWIFRHGLYGTERAHPHWYMHGLFA